MGQSLYQCNGNNMWVYKPGLQVRQRRCGSLHWSQQGFSLGVLGFCLSLTLPIFAFPLSASGRVAQRRCGMCGRGCGVHIGWDRVLLMLILGKKPFSRSMVMTRRSRISRSDGKMNGCTREKQILAKLSVYWGSCRIILTLLEKENSHSCSRKPHLKTQIVHPINRVYSARIVILSPWIELRIMPSCQWNIILSFGRNEERGLLILQSRDCYILYTWVSSNTTI